LVPYPVDLIHDVINGLVTFVVIAVAVVPVVWTGLVVFASNGVVWPWTLVVFTGLVVFVVCGGAVGVVVTEAVTLTGP